jgi:hypothetical protein
VEFQKIDITKVLAALKKMTVHGDIDRTVENLKNLVINYGLINAMEDVSFWAIKMHPPKYYARRWFVNTNTIRS